MTEVGWLRSQARSLHSQELYKETVTEEWTSETTRQGKRNTIDLLNELHEYGFAWSNIGRMIGVSVPALQKWRKGKIASGANRNRLAGLVAAGTLIQRNYMVEEIASWFEKPLVAGCPVTPIDMYARGDCVLVFGHAGGHLGPEQILDSYEPE